jgi:hypothetical protein
MLQESCVHARCQNVYVNVLLLLAVSYHKADPLATVNSNNNPGTRLLNFDEKLAKVLAFSRKPAGKPLTDDGLLPYTVSG